MPTTFNVFDLGIGPVIDADETIPGAEGRALLNGLVFGTPATPLVDSVEVLSPDNNSFESGTTNAAYETLDVPETMIIGGEVKTFDSINVYNDTIITYTDGTTATISAVIFQTQDLNLYLAPEAAANADQVALEAKPIQSITVGTAVVQNSNLGANRQANEVALCFSRGTRILTPGGYRMIETLKAGDWVQTVDNGAQRLEWVGGRDWTISDFERAPSLLPVRLSAGHFGLERDVLVSQQHCVAMGGSLVRAKHLAELRGPGARIARGARGVSYRHLMCDRHQVLIADGMESESFYPGPMALATLGLKDRETLLRQAPELALATADRSFVERSFGSTARPVLSGRAARTAGHIEELSEVA